MRIRKRRRNQSHPAAANQGLLDPGRTAELFLFGCFLDTDSPYVENSQVSAGRWIFDEARNSQRRSLVFFNLDLIF